MNIVLYTKNDCPLCEDTKQTLLSHKIPYQEKVIGIDITRDEVLELYPQARIAPIITMDGVFVEKDNLNFVLFAWHQEKGNKND
jgi:glutaredoxin